MKVRSGFVSNSSSSSFILRKSALNPKEMNEIKEFFKLRDGWFNTEIMGEDDKYLWGDLEAHNQASSLGYDEEDKDEDSPEDDDTASKMFSDMMDDLSLTPEDYCIKYEDFVAPEDLGDKDTGWKGERFEDTIGFC